MGESQVIILQDIKSGHIYFSGVIDCFCDDTKNLTIDILKHYKIENLDFLCWTHPDEDHSVGICDIFDSFGTNKTNIICPEGINGLSTDFVNYSKETELFFKKIKDNNTNRKYNVNSTSVVPHGSNLIHRLRFSLGLASLDFNVISLAPISAIVKRRLETGLSIKNDISVALMIELGEIKVFLSGDVMNSTIGQFESSHFEKLTYLKTPHHTSYTSDKLLDIFDEEFLDYKIPLTCTTGYQVHNLPDLKLVNQYKNYTEKFYSTYKYAGSHGYGIIKAVFDPFTLTYTESLEGDANKLF